MSLHTNIHQNLRKIASNIGSKHRKLVEFGFTAFTLTKFQSAASNARMVVANRSTAGRKTERLLGNSAIGDELNQELAKQVNLTTSSVINVDHTDINFLTALVGAVQTNNGRAVPVFVETTYANGIPSDGSLRSTNRTNQLRKDRAIERTNFSFMDHVISSLSKFVSSLGFTPKFAFDRGFGSIALIRHLDAAGATFYIRMKSGRIVDDGTQQIRISDISSDDEVVELGGQLLRVIRSDSSSRYKEYWNILTNDFTSTREKIIRIYYHRFEIEELFKDIKHILDLRRIRFNKPNSLKVLLVLAFIGISLLFKHRYRQAARILRKTRATSCHPKKALSWLKEMWEFYFLSCNKYRGRV
jgi:hypothetical protein